MVNDCIFCDIVAGKAPASFVYQDDLTLAFMSISPVNAGDVVVVPKKHLACLAETDETTGTALFRTAMRVCKAIRACGIKYDGIDLFQADGEAAGQEVFHVHINIIPRLKGDSMRITANWKKPERQDLDNIAVRIRTACESPH